MIVDGLTKSLYTEQHKRFVQQLGLVDIEAQLAERQPWELETDLFDQLEDTLDGGEAEIGQD